MCSKLTAEQPSIGTCNNNMDSFPQQAIDKKVPAFHILNFIKEKKAEITIYLVEHLKHIIQLICF